MTPTDAALTLQVVLAIYRSAEEGRPVAIPPATERRLLPETQLPDRRGVPKEAETSDGRDRSATAEADDLRRG